jgi:hypothetical protein
MRAVRRRRGMREVSDRRKQALVPERSIEARLKPAGLDQIAAEELPKRRRRW